MSTDYRIAGNTECPQITEHPATQSVHRLQKAINIDTSQITETHKHRYFTDYRIAGNTDTSQVTESLATQILHRVQNSRQHRFFTDYKKPSTQSVHRLEKTINTDTLLITEFLATKIVHRLQKAINTEYSQIIESHQHRDFTDYRKP